MLVGLYNLTDLCRPMRLYLFLLRGLTSIVLFIIVMPVSIVLSSKFYLHFGYLCRRIPCLICFIHFIAYAFRQETPMAGISFVWSTRNRKVVLSQGCCHWSWLNIFQVPYIPAIACISSHTFCLLYFALIKEALFSSCSVCFLSFRIYFKWLHIDIGGSCFCLEHYHLTVLSTWHKLFFYFLVVR